MNSGNVHLRQCQPIRNREAVQRAVNHLPRAELYGFPKRARTNLSSLLKENRRTASIRSSSSWESPILRSSACQPRLSVTRIDTRCEDIRPICVLPVLEVGDGFKE